jgi:hypothetical protein
MNKVNQRQKLNSSGGFQREFFNRGIVRCTRCTVARGPWPMLTSMAAFVFLRGNENQAFSFAGIYQSLHPRSYDFLSVRSFHGEKIFLRLDGSQRCWHHHAPFLSTVNNQTVPKRTPLQPLNLSNGSILSLVCSFCCCCHQQQASRETR